MADEWFYTQQGKQQGPVGAARLKELAAGGSLLPTDLVWKEGMANWVAARSTRGLFPSEQVAAKPLPVQAAAPLPTAEYEEEEEERPRRARRRKRRGLGAGAWAVIIGGTVGVLLLVGGVIWAIVTFAGGDTRSWNLPRGQKVAYQLRFTGGKKVELWVTSDRDTDVDLFVFDPAGRQVVADEGDSKDCYVWFVPPATQTYRVEVQNRVRMEPFLQHRNGPNSGTLRFKESDQLPGAPVAMQQPPPPVAAPPVQAPAFQPVQPPIVQPVPPPAAPKDPLPPPGANSWSADLRPMGKRFHLIQLKAGQPVEITVTSEQNTDVDLYVFDNARRQVAADITIGPNSRVNFVPARTGLYRVELHNLDPALPNRSHVRWTQ
jgi:hypothetical protein